MYKIKMGTMPKLMWYLHPGRKTLRKAALFLLIPVYMLSYFVILTLADNSFGLLVVFLWVIICIPLCTAYYYSSDFLSFLRDTEDSKAVRYDFVNSSRYMGDNVRLGEIFIFPRNGQIPFRYESIRRIDLVWVTGKGYGIVITLNDRGKFVLCERGASPLTRGEGMDRYRPFIRELQRHIPEIARELWKDEKKNKVLNGYAKENQARIRMAEKAISELLRPPEVTQSTWLSGLFFMLLVTGCLFMVYRLTWNIMSPDPSSSVLVACIIIINLLLSGFQFYDYNITETLAKIQDFELRMQSFREEGLFEELQKDIHFSVPYLHNQLLLGEKYLFLRKEGTIYEYSGITKVEHFVSNNHTRGKEDRYYYKITDRGGERTLRVNTKYIQTMTLSVFKEADQELRKKNPDIVVVPLAEKPKRFI